MMPPINPAANGTGGEEPGFVGIIPAAGLGSRLAPLGYPKELLPITFELDAAGSGTRPRAVMAYSLELMRHAHVKRVCVVISNWKFEIARVFENGGAHGLSLCYLIRGVPRGLADALDAASSWVIGCDVCLALPDTIVRPASAMRDTCVFLQKTKADVVLGVFPTATPEQLGPVRIGENQSVAQVLDKPKYCSLKNTWGIAAWGPRFTRFLADANARSAGSAMGPVLGDVFQAAIETGLNVRAKYFNSGRFFDLGTPCGLEEFLRWSMRRRSRFQRPNRRETSAADEDQASLGAR